MNANDFKALEKLPALYSTDDVKGDLPAVKLFTPDAGATWVLWEYDPESKIAFGLCDLGLGFPELGTVSIDEVHALRGQFGLPVERDLYGADTRFEGYKSIGEPVPDWLVA